MTSYLTSNPGTMSYEGHICQAGVLDYESSSDWIYEQHVSIYIYSNKSPMKSFLSKYNPPKR
jgi:hypothetical protein